MKQRSRELNNFEEIVEKAVDAKAKTALRPCIFTYETDQYCARGNRFAASKSHAHGPSIKNASAEKAKSQLQKPRSSENQLETSEKVCKNWKRKVCHYSRDPRQQTNSHVVTGVNTINVKPGQKQEKYKNWSQDGARDPSKIKFYNFQKLAHYTNKYLNLKN